MKTLLVLLMFVAGCASVPVKDNLSGNSANIQGAGGQINDFKSEATATFDNRKRDETLIKTAYKYENDNVKRYGDNAVVIEKADAVDWTEIITISVIMGGVCVLAVIGVIGYSLIQRNRQNQKTIEMMYYSIPKEPERP